MTAKKQLAQAQNWRRAGLIQRFGHGRLIRQYKERAGIVRKHDPATMHHKSTVGGFLMARNENNLRYNERVHRGRVAVAAWLCEAKRPASEPIEAELIDCLLDIFYYLELRGFDYVKLAATALGMAGFELQGRGERDAVIPRSKSTDDVEERGCWGVSGFLN
jgi:hypothetical protein